MRGSIRTRDLARPRLFSQATHPLQKTTFPYGCFNPP